MTVSLREILEKQQDVRAALVGILRKNPISFAELAREIGISIPTIRKFLLEEKNLDYRSLFKIEHYLEKQKS